jgi:hypothetical protein
LNLNFGGSGDFPNFLFQDTLYFGISLTLLAPAGSKNKRTAHFSPKAKTRLAAREERETRKIKPTRFLVGGFWNRPPETTHRAAGGLSVLAN